jgi:hypothetical protein
VAVGTKHRGDLAVPQAGQSDAYFAATGSIASTLGVGHAPSAGRRRGGGLVAASSFVRGSQRVPRTSQRAVEVTLWRSLGVGTDWRREVMWEVPAAGLVCSGPSQSRSMSWETVLWSPVPTPGYTAGSMSRLIRRPERS